MAATAIAVQLRPKHRRTILNPSLIHFFSSPSASGPDVEDQNNASSSPSPTQSEPSVSSYFSDVKASLKHSTPPRKPSSFSSTTGPAQTHWKVASIEEIRKNLSEFRRGSAVPTPENKSASASTPENKEAESRIVGVSFKDLRDSPANMRALEAEESKKQALPTPENKSASASTPENMEAESRIFGLSFKDLRDSLAKLRALEAEESKKQALFPPRKNET